MLRLTVEARTAISSSAVTTTRDVEADRDWSLEGGTMNRSWNFVALVGLAALVASGCPSSIGPAERADLAASGLEKVTVGGAPVDNGFYDPSLEYDDKGTGWLAYSRVEIPKSVSTELATSTDHGRTWRRVATINQSTDGTADVRGKSVEGTWRYETPSLLRDPSDVPERRWKLFTQRYLAFDPYGDADRAFDAGWIELRTAARPEGPWSPPVRLFGSKGSGARVDLNALSPELSANAYYNEIGSIVVDGVIYLSLDASPTESGLGEWSKRRVILVASPDHGETWKYAGTLTRYEDAEAFGYRVFTGSSLVRSKNRIFALLTPSGAFEKDNKNHDGTYVVEFEDIATAKLKRGPDGKLLVAKTFKRYLDAGGLSDFDERNTAGGLVMSQIDVAARPDIFQTYSTRQQIDAR
jgi:hypothetical protein